MYMLATNHSKGDQMVTKSKGAGAKKKGKVKVLNLNKETVKDLTAQERKKIKGGLVFASQVW